MEKHHGTSNLARCNRWPRATTPWSWKGEAAYSDIEVGGEVHQDAAWHSGDPKPAAARIKDRIAFWKVVTVEG